MTAVALTKSFDHLVQRRMATDAACDRCVIIDAPGGGRSRRDGAFDDCNRTKPPHLSKQFHVR